MIETDGFSKAFGAERAVEDVSLRLTTAVVGTSGSGKSTLLRMINRLIGVR